MCGFPHKKFPPVTAGRKFFYSRFFALVPRKEIYNRAVLWYTTLRTAYSAVFAASGGRGNAGEKPRESVTVKPPEGG